VIPAAPRPRLKDEVPENPTQFDPRSALVTHLSKEIETLTKNIAEFRARIALSIFLGPFILLGSLLVAAKDSSGKCSAATNVVHPSLRASVVCVSVFLILGWMAGTIEEHMWDQCNKWRLLILRLIGDTSVKVEKSDLYFKKRVTLCYFIVFLLLLVGFVSTTHLLFPSSW